MPQIRVVPLGAGQDVGRSCILVAIGGKNVMLDCGMHMGYSDERRFPDFKYIGGDLDERLDCVIITHFHLDHCGALPHMTEIVGYNGPVYMTYPTKAIVPVLLEDYRKIQTEYKGETNFYTAAMIKTCMNKVIPVNLHQVVHVDDELTIQAFYAGHVLGAAMFLVKVGAESILYTGDFNMTPDRHLGAAKVPPSLCPDLLITETTYANTIRDSKRARERDFLRKVHDTVVNKGGKVLIPVFALGRAQELCILLESYWDRLDLKIPIYFSTGLAEKATQFYRLFINWTNEKIKKTFVDGNAFDFKHILPFDRSYADEPGPMVLFSTPGMLHGGTSLQMFKKWCGDEKNMIIMPGYCVAGTVGAKVIAGAKEIDIHGQKYDVRMRVQYMSFSAHADAKGIMQLIKNVEPRHVMFVHGENSKMEFLKTRVEKEFNLKVFKPANGESITVESRADTYWEVPNRFIAKSIDNCPSSSKKACPLSAYVAIDKKSEEPELISNEEAARRMGANLHPISYGDIFEVADLNWEHLANLLRRYDSGLQVKQDGIEMFNGEILLLQLPQELNRRIEIVWDESREDWLSLVTERISAKKIQPQRSRQRIAEEYK